jgi:hypothetical protein
VLGVQHHADPLGFQFTIQPVGDLLGEPFLHLRSGREVLDHSGELGQPEDAVVGQVADVGDAGERQQVMLAEGSQRDRPGQTSSS